MTMPGNQKSVKDYYAILGVSPNASLEEIRLAYRRQARAFHPDLSTDPDAEDRFKEINEAYDVLANSEKRRAYDYFISGGGPATMPEDEETVVAPSASPAPNPAVTPAAATSSPAGNRGEAVTAEAKRQKANKKDKRSNGKRIYPPTWAILLIILGACIMVGVVVGAVLSLQRNRPTGGAESVTVSKLTTFLSPPEIPPDLTVLQEDNTPLKTVAPTEINVAGALYPVVAVLPEQGRWPLPTEQTSLAMWMHGTLINYVLGLPYTAESESRLSGLMSSDRITLTLENDTRLVFGSPEVTRVAVDDRSPLAQDKPGLTLMLLGGDQPSRLVVRARYLPENTLPAADQKADGLRVRVLNADVLQDAPPVADSWFFVVNYTITNTLGTEVDPTYFDMVLEDADGQRYVLNDEATRRGQFGQLTAPIPGGGGVVRGSAGYVIPRTVTPPLVWVFRADPTSSEQVRLVLNFEPPKPGPALPDVELYDVFLDGARDVIVVSGTVYNDGESNLTVTADLVKMTSQQGETNLITASPQLPWSIAGDDYQDFELQFSIPADGDAILLNILGFSFEIEGLAP